MYSPIRMTGPGKRSRPIRVAILAEFPLSALTGGAVGRGGGQGCTWLPQLAIGFESFPDLEIHWVIFDRKQRKRETIHAHGQTFHRIPGVPFSADLALNCLPARWLIHRELNRIQPDLVHAWGAELIYPSALRDFGGPRVFSLQGALNHYASIGGLPDDWRWRKMISSEEGFVKSATIVVSESAWSRERVLELDADADCRIVDYGVHPSFYETKWTPQPDKPYLIYVGGGGYRKGMDVLIEALKLLPERNWEIHFAGDEELQTAIASSGLNQVKYLGMLKWNDLRSAMSSAWGLVVPTRADTGPTVVKEARVIGLPVIGTNHGGLRDYIHHEVNGLIVDPLEPAFLADAMQIMMSSYERAVTLGRGRHENDREAFHYTLTARKLSDIYHELANRIPRSEFVA